MSDLWNKDLRDFDAKLLVAWDSKDLCPNRQASLMRTIKDIRQSLYHQGVRSKMRHHKGMFLIGFEPERGDVLLSMKTILVLTTLKESISADKEATLRDRQEPEPPITRQTFEDFEHPDAEIVWN